MQENRRDSHESSSPSLRPVTTDAIDGYISREHKKSKPRSHEIIKITGAVATSLAIYGSTWLGSNIAEGIEHGKQEVAGSHSIVHEVSMSTVELELPYRSHGTFVMTGLGTRNPLETAKALAVHREVGQVFAVEYSNQDLDIEDMAKRVIDQAKAASLKNVSFDGYSAGGSISLAIAAYIHEHEPNLRVSSVIMNSTPLGEGSLTEQSARGVALMNRILSLYEDFKYYENGRVLVEVVNRSDRYLTRRSTENPNGLHVLAANTFEYAGVHYTIDYGKLINEFHDVQKKMEDPDIASASLIKSQGDFITLADYNNSIRILSEQRIGDRDDPIPLIIFTKSAANADSVVNVSRSSENLLASVKRYGNSYEILNGDVGHANPMERLEQYQQMFRSGVHPRLTNLLIISMLRTAMKHDGVGHDQTDSALRPTERGQG